jgi:DNA-binding Lrp family transcriptional regulator
MHLCLLVIFICYLRFANIECDYICQYNREENNMLKPQDIVVLLKLHTLRSSEWTYNKLADSLGISASEVHAALKRCQVSGLYDSYLKKIRNAAVLEFLIHGIKYVFPAQPGAIGRGMPTAHSSEPLKDLVVSDPSNTYVWASPNGNVRGQTINPLYKSVPEAAKNDSELYQMLSLVDAIRAGRAREQQIACQELEKRLAMQ